MTGKGAVESDSALTGAESDARLLEKVRAGDVAAYGELWRRHAGPALSVAKSFVNLDAEDIVSEAFARVLRAIQAGGGPTSGFRPYLVMTVRNLGRRWYKTAGSLSITELERVVDPDAREGEVAAIADFEGSAVLTAFTRLPSRWQEVLWYSEVDGLKPQEISVLMDLAPNAVSALILRARRGLHDAWISAQLTSSADPECRAAIRDMGAFARGSLSERASSSLGRHVDLCEPCSRALIEAKSLASHLLVLVPAVASAGGAAGFLVSHAPPTSSALASTEGVLVVSDLMPVPKAHEGVGESWFACVVWSILVMIVVGCACLGLRMLGAAAVEEEDASHPVRRLWGRRFRTPR